MTVSAMVVVVVGTVWVSGIEWSAHVSEWGKHCDQEDCTYRVMLLLLLLAPALLGMQLSQSWAYGSLEEHRHKSRWTDRRTKEEAIIKVGVDLVLVPWCSHTYGGTATII